MASSANISLGPGWLHVAAIGTAEPTDLATPLPPGTAAVPVWQEVGYTAEGSTITYGMSYEPVTVAEEDDPVFHVSTGRAGTVTFAMAENTVRNLVIAFNGGKVTKTGTAPAPVIWGWEPPNPGEEVRRIMVWTARDNSERWILRRVFQTGDVEVARRKGTEYARLPVSFAIEAPGNNVRPLKALYSDARNGGALVTP